MFKTLFGVEPESIKETCVVTPFITKEIISGLQISKTAKGTIYSAGNNDIFSLVVARMGAGFVGDAVLHLKDTKCKKLIFFGSCGAAKETLKTGDILLVEKSFSQDSFVNMLKEREIKDIFYPDKELFDSILKNGSDLDLTKGKCLTVGSLKLEEGYLKKTNNDEVDVVDMETSAFLYASFCINRKAISVLFVTDIINKYPYYVAMQKQNLDKIKEITLKSSKMLFQIIK
ncbi:MAG: hypothetical protein JW871_01640 [Endomicrobiales bacterium]|nr:hypothetical protein [Endomicrobiales bacterium]